MNCLQAVEGVLIKFDHQQQHADFKLFKDRNQINCFLWSDDWKAGKDNVVVVDRSYERQAVEFINTSRL